MALCQKLESDVKDELKKLHNIKRMSKKQSEVAEEISNLIISNESPENWCENVKKYCKTPHDHNPNRVKEVQKLAFEHQLDYYLASILLASKCNNKREE